MAISHLGPIEVRSEYVYSRFGRLWGYGRRIHECQRILALGILFLLIFLPGSIYPQTTEIGITASCQSQNGVITPVNGVIVEIDGQPHQYREIILRLNILTGDHTVRASIAGNSTARLKSVEAMGPSDRSSYDADSSGVARVHVYPWGGPWEVRLQSCTAEQGNTSNIVLDRLEAPRFAAIKIDGKGFTRHAGVRIMWNNNPVQELAALSDGSIRNAWIWVPDSALDGVNKVQAVEIGNNYLKSNTVQVNVKRVSRLTLLNNMVLIIRSYSEQIPANPDWSFGWLNNLTWHLYLNPNGGKYRCGDYQDAVLRMLNNIRFNDNLQIRALMDGIDYTPMFSAGTAWYSVAWHAFVVAWPHGPALEGDVLDTSSPTWQKNGISLDPWIEQASKLYEMAPGSKSWAYDDRQRYAWGEYSVITQERTFYMPYTWTTPKSRIMDSYNDQFPSTGGDYYQNLANFSITAANAPQLQEAPAIGITTESPVRLEVRDMQGRRIYLGQDSKVVSEIPGAFALADAKNAAPGYKWYVSLPSGAFDVRITAIADGSYQFRSRAMNQPLHLYPRVAVRTGDIAEIRISDKPDRPQLRTSRGETLDPIAFTPPYTVPNQGPMDNTGPGAEKYPDISGTWYMEGRSNAPASVQGSGGALVLVNEKGDRSRGHFAAANIVVADEWQGGLRGTLNASNTRIDWANGSVWTRSSAQPPNVQVCNIAGGWQGVNGDLFLISQNGQNYSWAMTNHGRENASGRIDGSSITVSWSGDVHGSGSASGRVECDARGSATRIIWNNGAVFIRQK